MEIFNSRNVDAPSMLPKGNGQVDPRSLASQPLENPRYQINHSWLVRRVSSSSVCLNFGIFTFNGTIIIPSIGGTAMDLNYLSNILSVSVANPVYIRAKFTYSQVAPSGPYPNGTVSISACEIVMDTAAAPAPTSTVTYFDIASLDNTGAILFCSYSLFKTTPVAPFWNGTFNYLV